MSNPPTLSLAPHILEVEGESAFTYLARAKELERQGMSIVSFGIGQPDFDTPAHIKEAAAKALDEGFTGYTPTAGIAEAREAIAEYLNQRYGAGVSPEEVLISPGAKGAIFTGMLAFLSPGDEVIVLEPSYPAYAQIAKALHAKPVYVPIEWRGRSEGFKINLGWVEEAITERTRMIVLNNPQNPTGALFSPKQVMELLDLARDKGLILLADEIYDNFIYDAEFRSVLQDPAWRDNVIYINGLSKTFAMTGWRLGYLVARREIMEKMAELAVNIYSCATSFAQKAVAAAYRGPWEPVREMVEIFKRRRDMLHERLSRIPGFEVWKPLGAFYMFPSIKGLLEKTGMTSKDFATKLLEEYGVVVLPGTAFPDQAGEGFLRFSYASSFEDIEEGTRRISKAVEDMLSSAKR